MARIGRDNGAAGGGAMRGTGAAGGEAMRGGTGAAGGEAMQGGSRDLAAAGRVAFGSRGAGERAELERLGDEIAVLAAHIHAATYRLLALLAEFDRRDGWGLGFKSCADWLSWRTGIGPGAAREKVRAARALERLPRIGAAMRRGELSYAKVRAVTRVATPENEDRLLEVARSGTAAQVERIVRAWRRTDRLREAETEQRRRASRQLTMYVDEDGSYVVRGRLDPEVGALLERALDAASTALFQNAYDPSARRRKRRDASASVVGAADERAGAASHHDGALPENASGAAETASASPDNASGAAETVSGASETASGAAETVSGASDRAREATDARAAATTCTPLPTDPTPAQRRADAIGLLAEWALGAGVEVASDEPRRPATVGRADRFLVVLHADAEALRDASEGHSAEPVRNDSLSNAAEALPSASAVSDDVARCDGYGAAAAASVSSHSGTAASSASAFAGGTGHAVLEPGLRVSAETSRRIACDTRIVRMTHAPDGSVLDIGRRSRVVPTPIRRALDHRDGGCRFPGCGSRYCDAHHVVHWADGGATRLDNLVLMCRRHHTAVHEEGFRVRMGESGEVEFAWPDGRRLDPVPAAPQIAGDAADALVAVHDAAGIAIDAGTAMSGWRGERFDLGYALCTLMQ